MTKDDMPKTPSGRVKRTPVGARNVLTVHGKDPEYHYRFVTDDGDRVEQFKDAGYEPAMAKDHRVGDKRINAPSMEGSLAQVSVGGGKKGILMRIRKEWYEQDQAAKAAEVDSTVAATKKQALSEADYGKIDVTRD